MSVASNTAGMVGRFGTTSYTSISTLGQKDPRFPPKYPKPSKFFKSRNLKDSENVIEEAEEELEETPKLPPSLNSSSSSVNSTVTEETFSNTPTTSKKMSNVSVAVRARPLLKEEIEKDPPESSILDVMDDQVIVALKKTFRFDKIFDENSCQSNVYSNLVQPIVEKVLANYNASIFAYGQTGTGKTFTMGTNNTCGPETSLGVIPRAIKQIFQDGGGGELSVKVSFYEIFNEQVFDLINPSQQRVPLSVREHKGFFKIVQLTETVVRDEAQALALLESGAALRSTQSNLVNLQSSRSHAVFTFNISSDCGDGFIVSRKLNLVDLAGSESMRRTQSTGDRFNEGVSINASLLTLGNVIRALANKQVHVPYRDSVLTKVLKESLQTTALVAMVACISPTGPDMQETINTLRFANKAKALVTKPVPALLLASQGTPAARKRQLADFIPPTPGINNTIHTPTPSKAARKNDTKRQLNLTIGTPGKRARGENTFTTPRSFPQRATSTATKTTVVDRSSPLSPTFSNLSGVSMIEHPEECEESSVATTIEGDNPEEDTRLDSKTFSIQDISSAISPFMRQMNEKFTVLTQEVRRLQSKKAESPKRNCRPRMTSSPVRSTRKSPRNRGFIQESQTANSSPALSTGQQEVSPSSTESLISGAVSRVPLQQVTNTRLQAVRDSTSPVLGGKLPRNSPNAAAASALPRSPTIEEMERCLGIGPESPGDIFSVASDQSAAAPRPARQSRRSARRTSMGGSELETTLQFIRESAASRRLSGRPTRAATLGLYYGSPNKENLQNNSEKDVPAHPLMNRDAFQIDPARQREHNRSILSLLNNGNLKLLTALPAIGPKTGLIIHGYRELHGGIKDIKELETVDGLGPKFLKKFLSRNQIVLDA